MRPIYDPHEVEGMLERANLLASPKTLAHELSESRFGMALDAMTRRAVVVKVKTTRRDGRRLVRAGR